MSTKSWELHRFKLQAHVEQRERPIFKVVFARADKRLGPDIHQSRCADGPADCGHTTANTNGIKSGTITSVGTTMADLGVSLSPYAERRVFDATGLEGRYDFQVQWSEDVSISEAGYMTASDFDHAYGFLLTRGRSPYMRRL